MRVLLLSPYVGTALRPLQDAFAKAGDQHYEEHDNPDFIVLYGHRHILKGSILRSCPIVNLHISYLPYNRGASPNLWSWYDNTPKGVSLHYVDKGIDTGPLIARQRVTMSGNETLATSYAKLHKGMGVLFGEMWPYIRKGITGANQWHGFGSAHTIAQSEALMARLPAGYNTPCALVEQIGGQDRKAELEGKQVG